MNHIFNDDPRNGVIYVLSDTVLAAHIYQSLTPRQKARYEFDEQVRRYVHVDYRLTKDERRILSGRGVA